MTDIVQDIKQRLTIEQVVGEYVELRKSGRSFKGLCPFHKEKTPSFIVTPDKGLAYCFGCHNGGDMFEFIQLIEGVDFPESIRILATKAGIDVSSIHFDAKLGKKKNRLFELHRQLNESYQKKLTEKSGKIARQYLDKRGVTQKSIQNFHIGYAPDEWLYAYELLIQEQFTEDEMLLSGAFVRSNEGKVYDRFRHRLMFPITNSQGSILAFSGRALDSEEKAKYINSADSKIFSKKSALFGLSQARQSIREMDYVIVMEGQFDVVLSHQVGIKNVVASSGTAFTREHLHILSRYTHNIVFAFDSDRAGREAAQKAILLALGKEWNVKALNFPEQKDAADIVSESGKEALIGVIQAAQDAIFYYCDTVIHAFDSDSRLNQKRILESLRILFHTIPSTVDKNAMIEYLAVNLRLNKDAVSSELRKKIQQSVNSQEKEVEISPRKKASLLEYIFAFFLFFPQSISYLYILEPLLMFCPEEYHRMYEALKIFVQEDINESTQSRLMNLEIWETTRIPQLSVFLAEKYPDALSDEDILEELERLVRRLTMLLKKKKLQQITLDMKIAEQDNDQDAIQELQKQQLEVLTL